MPDFRVIIVGGGLGGLTLANCLQHAGIDFLLLEGREKIGLHVGAGVGIEPNGDRILDQLGVLSDLEGELVANRCFIFRDVLGRLMYTQDLPTLVKQRTGYFPWVYERCCVLEALYNRIWDKEKVLVDKRVRNIVYEDDRAAVICEDGSKYLGDVVVGGDGVHSIVRKQMWHNYDLEEPGKIACTDNRYFTAEYRGLYGISGPVEGLGPGTMTFVAGQDEVCYWMAGKDGRLYWCLVEKLKKQVQAPNIPKYNDEDVHAYAEGRLDKILLSDTAKVKFGDIWAKRRSWALVPVEEGDLGVWTRGRIVCIGDSVHKVTPESGQGANQAIESAASLANYLKRMTEDCPKEVPSAMDIEKCLCHFQANRRPRASEVVKETNMHVRVMTFRTPVLKFVCQYIAPMLGDLQANKHGARHIGAERVEFLPIPARSVTGTMPFNPTQGIANYKSRGRRALFASPLLVLTLFFSLSARQNPVSLLQILEMPTYLVWLVEGSRRANFLKPIQWTLLFGVLAHIQGFTLWANIWFFLYYVWSPIEVYAALDQRLLQMNYARTILPSIVFAALSPLPVMLIYPDTLISRKLLSLWSWLPILLSVTHRFFATFAKDTTIHDRLYNVKADLPYLRRAYIIIGIVSFASFQYLRYNTSGSGFSSVALVPFGAKEPHSLTLHFGEAFWLMLLFRDLRKGGMVKQSWATLWACFTVSMIVMGPGATLLAGWAWREEVLASKRHWAAITKAGWDH